MTENAHYFLAIPLPHHIKEWVRKQQNLFLNYGKLTYKHVVDPADFHITLKFLGAMSPTIIDELMNVLKIQVISSPFQLTIGGIGFFGLENHPRVSWLNVEKNEALINLYNQIEQVTLNNGFQQEKRAYQPHITLTKKWVKGDFDPSTYEEVQQVINEIKSISVTQMVLYQVKPQLTPRYQLVDTIRL